MAGSGVILTSDLDRAIAERSQIWAAYDEALVQSAELEQLAPQIKYDGVVTPLAALTPGASRLMNWRWRCSNCRPNCRVLHARRPISRRLSKRFRKSRTNGGC